jgi:hypothetical protein
MLEMHKDYDATCGSKKAPNRGKRFPIQQIGEKRSDKHDGAEQCDGLVRREQWRDSGRHQIEKSNRNWGWRFPDIGDEPMDLLLESEGLNTRVPLPNVQRKTQYIEDDASSAANVI